jgi:hypothetical protein
MTRLQPLPLPQPQPSDSLAPPKSETVQVLVGSHA